VAVHPSEENGVHEFYLMCADVEAFVAEMGTRSIACAPVADQGWGLLTQITLPGGGKLGVYQPRHARPKAMSLPGVGGAARKTAKKASRKKAPRTKAAGKKAARKTARKRPGSKGAKKR
jgi:hypothetical protein